MQAPYALVAAGYRWVGVCRAGWFCRRLLDLRRLHMSARALRDLGIDPPQSVALGLRGFAELGSLPPIKAPLLPLRAGTERLSSLRQDDGNPCNSGPHGCLPRDAEWLLR